MTPSPLLLVTSHSSFFPFEVCFLQRPASESWGQNSLGCVRGLWLWF